MFPHCRVTTIGSTPYSFKYLYHAYGLSPPTEEYYRAQGYQYKKIDDVGVLVFVEREKDVYLDKLYLTPSVRGKNYPAFVFAWLQRLGKDITLNVNQSNERAVRCYLKNGFVILSKTDIDLGDGMVNCDYVMQKRALS